MMLTEHQHGASRAAVTIIVGWSCFVGLVNEGAESLSLGSLFTVAEGALPSLCAGVKNWVPLGESRHISALVAGFKPMHVCLTLPQPIAKNVFLDEGSACCPKGGSDARLPDKTGFALLHCLHCAPLVPCHSACTRACWAFSAPPPPLPSAQPFRGGGPPWRLKQRARLGGSRQRAIHT